MTSAQIAYLIVASIPASIFLMSIAVIIQLYIVLNESYTLNRFSEKKLFIVIAFMMFTFSLAIYCFCPNARKKGILFLIFALLGIGLYFLPKILV